MPSPHLERKLKEALGEDAGAELAAVTDRIDPIRGDIAELRHSVRAEIAELRHSVSAEIAELRQGFARLEAKMDAGFAAARKDLEAATTAVRKDVDAAIASSAKEQTRFLFLAWAVLLAAIVGLYSR